MKRITPEFGFEIVHCYTSGSSSSSTSVDPWYNRIVATLQTENQQMTEEIYNTYKYGAGSYTYSDIATLNKQGLDTSGYYNRNGSLTTMGQQAMAANQWVINPETNRLSRKTYVDDPNDISQQQLEQAQITANMGLLPAQTELERLSLAEQTEATKQAGVARNKLYDLTMAGTDVTGAMNRAQADVEQGYNTAAKSATNEAFRAGVDPNSGQYAALQKQLLLNKSKGIAGARTTSRIEQEDKNYNRLAGLSAYGL